MKHIVFDIETIPQDETKLLALAPEFAAPANLKDPEKIAAAIARKRADYLADAALNWKTAEVVLIGAGDDTGIQSFTAATEKGGLLTANRIVDAQRDPALVGPTPTFITRTHTLRAIPNPKLNDELQLLACGSHSPTPSCQVSVSVWNYYLNTLDFKAPPLMFGDGTELMTVNRYWGLRAVAGL